MEIDVMNCGCIMGWYLCPEAARLWRLVGDVYENAQDGTGTWEAYEAARKAYSQHYAELAGEVVA